MKALIFFVAFTICCNGFVAFAADVEQDDYLSLLVQQARIKNLAGKRYWHLLVHYKKTIFGSYESQEDGPNFFSSPEGKTNPQAELIATLESFFKSPGSLKPGEENPQCIFPARYKWLKKQLVFDPSRLPEARCERLESWIKGLDPEKITMVFASYYMNNPASMFGHTFLRIDKKRKGPEQKLLDYGVNFAALADSGNQLVTIFKGLFGGFKGIFSISPYYVKVQEYNNLEIRDLWEYELTFNDDQINYLLLHLWELGGNYFDYYYFQENCSYQILPLLEVANPELHLTDQFLFHVIPADTVKVLTDYPGLISKRVYRPSLLSQMKYKQLQMNSEQKEIFYALVKDPSWIKNEPYLKLGVPEKALILDTYLDYSQYQNMQRERTAGVIDATTRSMLLARSNLDFRRNDLREITHFSSPPELGHGSARVKLGIGGNENELFEEIAFRPAYHDLLAKDTGYGKNSQILFLDFTARYYNESGKIKLDNFKLIDIISLTPYDLIFKKLSWRLSIGSDTIRDFDCGYCNSFKTNYGIGLSYAPSYFSPFFFYSLIDLELEAAGRLNPDYRIGGGGTIGALIDFTTNWRIQITGDYLSFPLGDESHYYKVAVNQRYALSQNVDIRVEWNIIEDRNEWVSAVNYYF